MRQVTRQRAPRFTQSPEFRKAVEQLRDFHEGGGARARQARFPLYETLEPFLDEIFAALHRQFDSFCAYSEVPIDPTGQSELQLVWHRPTSDASSLGGIVDRDHYWWRTLTWANWYLASERVASVKSYQFPVAGRRTSTEPAPEHRRDDRGILLDPCREEPAWWLRFDVSGEVSAREHPSEKVWQRFEGVDRGQTTIQILGLNDRELVERRREAVRYMRRLVEYPADVPSLLDRLIEEKVPHRGSLIQILIRDRLSWRTLDAPSLQAREIDALVDSTPEVLAAELLAGEYDVEQRQRRQLIKLRDQLLDTYPDLVNHPRFRAALGVPKSSSRVGKARRTSKRLSPEREQVMVFPTDRITRVRIRNFRAIRDVEFAIDPVEFALPERYGEEEDEPIHGVRWTVLLGENGSGKSSMLHAVALAMAGPRLDEVMASAGSTWSDILRRSDEADQQTGSVRLDFTGGQQIDLQFDAERSWYKGLDGGTPEINVNVRAYGATRLLSTHTPETTLPLRESVEQLMARVEGLASTAAAPVRLATDVREARALLDRCRQLIGSRDGGSGGVESATSFEVGNLLDPGVSVLDAEDWLCSLDAEAFGVASLTLADLLGAPSIAIDTSPAKPQRRRRPRARITRNRARDRVLVDGDPLSLVSDGYRSVIAVGCDIMAGIGGLRSETGGISDFIRARGIVLIDEIGAHLHPSWRMQITGKFRRAFPNVQFIMSTHEPLCLRGLVETEVIRVSKYDDPHGVVIEQLERSPARYRVDQLLTSEFFGLDSAIDPDVDRRFARYSELLQKGRRTGNQELELRSLEQDLNRLRPILGYTRRDQLIYDAIDGFLGDTSDLSNPVERRARRETIVQRVKEQWLSASGVAT